MKADVKNHAIVFTVKSKPQVSYNSHSISDQNIFCSSTSDLPGNVMV